MTGFTLLLDGEDHSVACKRKLIAELTGMAISENQQGSPFDFQMGRVVKNSESIELRCFWTNPGIAFTNLDAKRILAKNIDAYLIVIDLSDKHNMNSLALFIKKWREVVSLACRDKNIPLFWVGINSAEAVITPQELWGNFESTEETSLEEEFIVFDKTVESIPLQILKRSQNEPKQAQAEQKLDLNEFRLELDFALKGSIDQFSSQLISRLIHCKQAQAEQKKVATQQKDPYIPTVFQIFAKHKKCEAPDFTLA